jgi:hypothetical protein
MSPGITTTRLRDANDISSNSCYDTHYYGASRYVNSVVSFQSEVSRLQVDRSPRTSTTTRARCWVIQTSRSRDMQTLTMAGLHLCRLLSASTLALSGRNQPNNPHSYLNHHRVAPQPKRHPKAQMAQRNGREARHSSGLVAPRAN